MLKMPGLGGEFNPIEKPKKGKNNSEAGGSDGSAENKPELLDKRLGFSSKKDRNNFKKKKTKCFGMQNCWTEAFFAPKVAMFDESLKEARAFSWEKQPKNKISKKEGSEQNNSLPSYNDLLEYSYKQLNNINAEDELGQAEKKWERIFPYLTGKYSLKYIDSQRSELLMFIRLHPHFVMRRMAEFLKLKDDKAQKNNIEKITKTLVDFFSDASYRPEDMAKIINNLIDEDKEERNIRELKFLLSLVAPTELGQEAITNLKKFYQEKIEFQSYKLNKEMNDKEVQLLESVLKKDEKILESGCGAGRLMLELLSDGYDVSGFDFTAKHIEYIKKQKPEANVFQGDWHNIAVPDESFDSVYSLGRNILHNYSWVDQEKTFREANRILRPGGKFIFDIPNREKGSYKQMADRYAEEMRERGIRYFRYGAIYDSPDGKNFATRYAYSPEDIKSLALMNGFKIIEMRKEALETGQGDENLYFVLEKVK